MMWGIDYPKFLIVLFEEVVGCAFVICIVQIESAATMFLSLVDLALFYCAQQVRSSFMPMWRTAVPDNVDFG